MKRPSIALTVLLSSMACVFIASATARSQPHCPTGTMVGDEKLICPYRGPGLPLWDMKFHSEHPPYESEPYQPPTTTTPSTEDVATDNTAADNETTESTPVGVTEQPVSTSDAAQEDATEKTDASPDSSTDSPYDYSNGWPATDEATESTRENTTETPDNRVDNDIETRGTAEVGNDTNETNTDSSQPASPSNASELLPSDRSNLPVLPDWTDTSEQNYYDESNTNPSTSQTRSLLDSLLTKLNVDLHLFAQTDLGVRTQAQWFELQQRVSHTIREYHLDRLVDRALHANIPAEPAQPETPSDDVTAAERDMLLGVAHQLDNVGSLFKLFSNQLQQAVIRDMERQANANANKTNRSR